MAPGRHRRRRWSRSTPRPTSSRATRASRSWCAAIAALAPAAKRRSRGAEGDAHRGTGRTVDEEVTQAIAVIGENIDAAPHRLSRGAAGRGRRLPAQPARRRASASSACWWRWRRTGDAGAARRDSASSSRCTSPPTNPQARRRADALDPGRGRARAGDLRRPGARLGQAREHHREDGRGPDAQVLRGSRCCSSRSSSSTRTSG